eukprot:1546822-Pyramimonas_sp.AAC.1
MGAEGVLEGLLDLVDVVGAVNLARRVRDALHVGVHVLCCLDLRKHGRQLQRGGTSPNGRQCAMLLHDAEALLQQRLHVRVLLRLVAALQRLHPVEAVNAAKDVHDCRLQLLLHVRLLYDLHDRLVNKCTHVMDFLARLDVQRDELSSLEGIQHARQLGRVARVLLGPLVYVGNR